MPEMSSWASGRHRPPASSASCAYTTLPPGVGFVVSDDAALVPELLLFLLEHAAASMSSASSSAPNRPVLERDDTAFGTVPPGCRGVGCRPRRVPDVRDRPTRVVTTGTRPVASAT